MVDASDDGSTSRYFDDNQQQRTAQNIPEDDIEIARSDRYDLPHFAAG